jgi:KDO2-lipid IV(A) lauroyltransferase
MIKFILTFFSILPLRINHFLGVLMGQFLYRINSKSRQIVSQNIELCFPDLTPEKQQKLIQKTLIETGKSLSESGYIWLRSFANNAQKIVNTPDLSCLESERAVILLVPHFGCWEITGRVLSLHKPITFLYKPLKNRAQQALLIAHRERGDLSMAAADRKGVAQLQRAIKNQQLIGILPDQNPGKEGGVLAPFFAQNIQTMTLLAKLARKNNAKVVLTWATRLPKGRGYSLNLKVVDILSATGLLKDDVAKMNKVIETLVRSQPEQYLWNYKRFKSVIDYP